MSVLLAVVAAVQATPVPSVSPVVTAAVEHHNSLMDTVNALASRVSTADLLVAAGLVTSGIQYLINHFKNLRKGLQWVLSIALPFTLVAGASFASGHNDLHLAPAVYLIGQLVYMIVEKIKDSVSVDEPVVEPVATF